MVPRAMLLVAVCLTLGCGSSDDETVVVPPAGCAPGEWQREDGRCVPAGLPPDMPCPPGEWLRDDGECIPAGVPADGCGQGFVHDGDRGCEPILPVEPCPPGLMAVPGETTCREVAPCALGKWGDIPIESDTEHVDASYAGLDSDGSVLKPWRSIQAAVDDALPGAIVAVAEGSYLEDVTVGGKPVRIWGVCPALVEIVGTGSTLAALLVLTGATGTEVRDLSIRGDAGGLGASGSLDVLLERLWVHDNARFGVDAENDLGPTRITLRASLLEQNHEIGLAVVGSEATAEANVVRDTQPNAQGLWGRGVEVQPDSTTAAPSTLYLRASLLERNHDIGVVIAGSETTVDASVVRETQPDAQGLFGRGVEVQADPTTGAPSTLYVRASLVEQNHDAGVQVSGSDATLESSVVRQTQPNAQGLGGRGVNVQTSAQTSAPSTLALRASLLQQNHEIGVHVEGSDATLESSVVRQTQPNAQGRFGRAVNMQPDPRTGARSTLALRASLLEQNHEIGVSVHDSEATVEASVVRNTQPNAEGFGGRGVNAQTDSATGVVSTLLIRTSLVEHHREASVFVVCAVAMIESCLLHDTLANAEGSFGDGVVAWTELGAPTVPTSATLLATRIDQSARAAVAAIGAHAALGGSAFTCQAIDLDYETNRGEIGRLEDLGGNLCGCPEPTAPCKAVSANLEPPPALESAPE